MAIGRKSGFLFSLVAIGVLAGGTGAAEAKGRGGRGNARGNHAELSRPAHAADQNAAGSVEVNRNGSTVTVRNLDPRTTYDVVDGQTGDRVGSLRTNKKGKGSFKFGGGKKTRAAENSGADAGELPDDLEIIDPSTGECVLEGDLTVVNLEDWEYLYGWLYEGDAETGTVICNMSSSTDPSMEGRVEDFSFTYCPPYGDGAEFEGDVPHTFSAGTYYGVDLPFGVESVGELSGRAFEVRDLDGNVLRSGVLPELETLVLEPMPGEDPGIWEGEWDNWEQWETGDGTDWTWDGEFNWDEGLFGDMPGFGMEPWFDGGPARANTRRSKEFEPELIDNGFRLWIENGEGDMEEVAPLLTYDWGDVIWIDDPIMGDPGDQWDWDGGWDGNWDDGWLDDGMLIDIGECPDGDPAEHADGER